MKKKGNAIGDYIKCSVMDQRSKWVTDSLMKGRRICVRGIGFCLISDDTRGKNSLELAPEIPACSSLLRLLQGDPELSDVTWTGSEWIPTPDV